MVFNTVVLIWDTRNTGTNTINRKENLSKNPTGAKLSKNQINVVTGWKIWTRESRITKSQHHLIQSLWIGQRAFLISTWQKLDNFRYMGKMVEKIPGKFFRKSGNCQNSEMPTIQLKNSGNLGVKIKWVGNSR